MHPAYSIILLTTASGAGYGLLILLALNGVLGLLPQSALYAAVSLGLAMVLITAGLFSSMWHLGHPERAWRALSQWRSSWLSREGVCAILTYVPMLVFASGWMSSGKLDGLMRFAAVLSALLALFTVYCTGMIYASLRTVVAWHQALTVPNYLILALASGAVLQVLLLAVCQLPSYPAVILALLLLALGLVSKCLYWRAIDRTPLGYTREQAIGLRGSGPIRQIEPAHTQPNYVMREMGYAVARKHSARMRILAAVLGFGIPAGCLLLITGIGGAAPLGALATLSLAIGLLIERWLFFAEAVHVVTLYYEH